MKGIVELAGYHLLGALGLALLPSASAGEPVAIGSRLELFVDADPAVWRNDPAAVATIEPLEL